MKEHEKICRFELGACLMDKSTACNVRGVRTSTGYLVVVKDAFKPIKFPVIEPKSFDIFQDTDNISASDLSHMFSISWMDAYRTIRDNLFGMNYYVLANLDEEYMSLYVTERFVDKEKARAVADTRSMCSLFDLSQSRFIIP